MRKISLKTFFAQIFIFTVILFIFFRSFNIVNMFGTINVIYLMLAFGCFVGWLLASEYKIRIFHDDYLLLAYILMVVADGLFRTPHSSEAFEYWSLLVAAFAFKLVIQCNQEMCSDYMRYAEVSTFILSISIVLSAIAPTLMDGLRKLLLGSRQYIAAADLYNRGYTIGFAHTGAQGAFYSVVLLSISMAAIFTRKGSARRTVLLVLISGVALLLSQKRGLLFASAATAYLLFFLFDKNKSVTKSIKILLITFLLILIGIIAILTIPAAQYMWNKTLYNDRVLSGRESFWNVMVQMFESAPVFGVGGGTCDYLFGFGGHNCYLQLLMEYGIVGLFVFCLAFGVPYVRCILKAKVFIKQHRYTQRPGWLIASIFMQSVFFIYALSGNPVFDQIFFMTELISIGIAQNVLNHNVELEKSVNEKTKRNYPSISSGKNT